MAKRKRVKRRVSMRAYFTKACSRPRQYRSKRKTYRRKGKLSNWLKGALIATAPAVAATGIGLVKQLLKKNTGYSDIYA